MAGSVNGMALVFFIPFRQARGFVHVLDNLSPADTGVVSAEANLAFLCAVRDDAHFGAAEVIIEQILKPHALNTQDTPDIVRVIGRFGLHAVVAIRARVG